MFPENRFYGHADILLSYCGLPPRTTIPMRLQHGWQPGPGMRPSVMDQPGPKIVWSSRNLERASAGQHRGAVAIGAPWLYMAQTPDPGPEHPRSVLAVPFHGWEQEALSDSMVNYAEALEQLEADGFGPITVCLYWFEYEQPVMREVFERRGFSVTTMGHREDNPEFLHRQRELIWRHAFVSSNRVCTAAFYALEARRAFFFHGPPAGLSASDDPSGERYETWQRETFPELTRERFDEQPNPTLGDTELGAEHKRSPEQLRELLMLDDKHRGTRLRLSLARRAHDLGKLLGLGRRE